MMKKETRTDSKGNELFPGEYERADGRYLYRYKDREGNTKYIYAARLSSLRNEEARIAYLNYLNISSQIRNITLNDQYELWIASKTRLRRSTRAGYRYLYDSYIRNSLGKRQIDEISKYDIKCHYSIMHVDQRLSAEMISHVQNVVYQVFESAMERNIIFKNPADNACKEFVRSHSRHKSTRKGLSGKQAEAFLGFLFNSDKYKRWYPVICVLISTGLRISELTGLRWEDISFVQGVICVDHAIIIEQTENGRTEMRAAEPKTPAGNRKIPLNDRIIEALDMEKEYQRENGIVCKTTIDGYTGFVFLNRFGGVIKQDSVNRPLKKMMMDYNEQICTGEDESAPILPYLTTHSFRHTFANILCEKGVSIKTIQYLMGHDDISTTMDIYTKPSEEMIMEEYKQKTQDVNYKSEPR